MATASLPTNPTMEAAITAHSIETACGCIRRWIACHAAMTALAVIVRMMARPARSSTRPRPYVKRRVEARRASTKAIPSGMAVAASAKLWIVSASSATLPDRTTTTTWISAVAMRPTKDHFSAQRPRSVEAIEASTTPWLCP